MRLTPKQAEQIAVDALIHIAGDGDRLARFSALSGIDPALIRDAATEPGFLAGVLEYFLGHEPDLIVFAESAELPPERVAEAYRLLGGDSTAW